jgi:hypothetical protein
MLIFKLAEENLGLICIMTSRSNTKFPKIILGLLKYTGRATTVETSNRVSREKYAGSDTC